MSYTIPPDTRAAGTGNPPLDINNISDVLTGNSGIVHNVLNTAYAGGADPTGSADSTAAIQAALLSFGTLTGWSAGQGGICHVPQGTYTTSKTLIIPSGVRLVGDGWASQLNLVTDSVCDMIQFATYNSSSQAAILGVSASSIRNAFWAGVEKLALHGDAFHATIPAYCHGINITTNGVTSTGPGDPDFDPSQTVRDVWIKAVTGDGIYHSGRSGALFERILCQYHNGNGFSPSFDTTMIDCLAESCNTGFYLNHGSVCGTGCKSFNNLNKAWVSGNSYSPNSFGGRTAVAVYSGVMYFCTAAVSGSTPPPSDAAHWTALTATSPVATGNGFYWDSNSGEHNWTACDGQQNATSDYYFKSPSGAITVVGSSTQVNYNNSTNPNNYACVTFDGATKGVTAIINSSGQGGSQGVICNGINSPSNCTLIASTDSSENAVLAGTHPTFALVNGKSLTDTLAADTDVSITSPSNGQVLSYNSGASKWENVSSGSSFYGGLLGDGSNGAITLDGTTGYHSGASGWIIGPTSNVYNLSQDIFVSSLTVNAGITLNTNGYRIFCNGTVTVASTGNINGNGASATSATGGSNTTNTAPGGSNTSGGNGGTGNGTGGTGNQAVMSANGGGGGNGSGHTGGAFFGYVAAIGPPKVPQVILSGVTFSAGTTPQIGIGLPGGGGGGDGTNSGGGGGAGGHLVLIIASAIINNGTIQSVGGSGFHPTTGNCGGGGGGSAGAVLSYTLSAVTGTGTWASTPGTGAAGIGTGTAGSTPNNNDVGVLNVVLS